MSHFLNSRTMMVCDAIDGEILSAGGRLARLDGYPDIRVVIRSDWDRSTVAIISGGGAGHEPAHIGFVGKGMLTAAVCGDVFASPSTEAVLAAILAVAGAAGVLLIVKNYTGDRLNFGLAAERARAKGIATEMVIVGDDIALPDLTQPRGIAGTLFVHKIAGHAADEGRDLASVKTAAETAARDIRSIGMALTSCTVPGREGEERIPEGEAEIGLGIHGEPGAERAPVGTAIEMVDLLLQRLGPPQPGIRLALLINNLGGLPPIECAVITKAILGSPFGQQADLIIGPAALMTSLDMKGVSLSVLQLDEARRLALTASTEAAAWPGATPSCALDSLSLPEALTAALKPNYAVDPRKAAEIQSWLNAAFDALIGVEGELNLLDAKVGDGDTGTTVASAARTLKTELDSFASDHWGEVIDMLAQRVGRTMGGSSGVLVSIFLAASAGALKDRASWAKALRIGLQKMAFYGGAAEGDRTMIDALAPAVAALEAGGDLAAMADAAMTGAKRTATIAKTRYGRSSYINAAELLGTPDPGASAVALLLDALARHERSSATGSSANEFDRHRSSQIR